MVVDESPVDAIPVYTSLGGAYLNMLCVCACWNNNASAIIHTTAQITRSIAQTTYYICSRCALTVHVDAAEPGPNPTIDLTYIYVYASAVAPESGPAPSPEAKTHPIFLNHKVIE